MTSSATPESAPSDVRRATSAGLEIASRLGHAAKGLVYLIIGALAFMSAVGVGGETTDAEGALDTIAGQPYGRIMLGVVAIGLAGYVAWRFVQAGADAENRGNDAKGIVIRFGYAVSGIAHALLAVTAAQIAFGFGVGGGDDNRDWTAWLLSMQFGRYLVAAVGLIVGGVGVVQLWRAYTADFMQDYNYGKMSPKQRKWSKRLGQFGLAARGITFGIIGWFFLQAAWQADASQSGGLAKALQKLAAQPYGPWLLGVVGLGLAAYGVYCFSRARYRDFEMT